MYLSDFGISKGAASSAGLTGTGQYLGTPDYTSPEQVKGLAVDGRADQYALACVAWQLLTGTVPFQRDEGLDVLFAHLHEPPPPLDDRCGPDLPAAAGQVLARAHGQGAWGAVPVVRGVHRRAAGRARPAPLPARRPGRPGPASAHRGLRPARDPATPGAAGHRWAGHGPERHACSGTGLAEQQDIDGPRAASWPGRARAAIPARPARRRRYLTITLAGALLAAATAASRSCWPRQAHHHRPGRTSAPAPHP